MFASECESNVVVVALAVDIIVIVVGGVLGVTVVVILNLQTQCYFSQSTSIFEYHPPSHLVNILYAIPGIMKNS